MFTRYTIKQLYEFERLLDKIEDQGGKVRSYEKRGFLKNKNFIEVSHRGHYLKTNMSGLCYATSMRTYLNWLKFVAGE